MERAIKDIFDELKRPTRTTLSRSVVCRLNDEHVERNYTFTSITSETALNDFFFVVDDFAGAILLNDSSDLFKVELLPYAVDFVSETAFDFLNFH